MLFLLVILIFFRTRLLRNSIWFVYVNGASIRSFILIRSGDCDFSNDRNLVQRRSWDRYCSDGLIFLIERILNVINVICLVVMLNNWLSSNFISRNIDSFGSNQVINLLLLSNVVKFNMFILIFNNLEINFFILNDGLNISCSVSFSSWFFNGLNSVNLSYNRFSLHSI